MLSVHVMKALYIYAKNSLLKYSASEANYTYNNQVWSSLKALDPPVFRQILPAAWNAASSLGVAVLSRYF